MAYVAVDKDGQEVVSTYLKRGDDFFMGFMGIVGDEEIWNRQPITFLPKGSIKKLTGRKLTWEDEPVELKEKDESK